MDKIDVKKQSTSQAIDYYTPYDIPAVYGNCKEKKSETQMSKTADDRKSQPLTAVKQHVILPDQVKNSGRKAHDNQTAHKEPKPGSESIRLTSFFSYEIFETAGFINIILRGQKNLLLP
jgi:hypothetical protein